MKERVKETKKKLDLLEKELAKKEKDVELHDEIKPEPTAPGRAQVDKPVGT